MSLIMPKRKRKANKLADRIAPIIIGVVIVLCSLIPVSEGLFGRTGYITEIRSSERFGGRRDEPGQPNTYEWHIGYTFKTESGELETGSVTVKGDAISAKSGLRVGSHIRYLAFAPRFNRPGEGKFDGASLFYLFLTAFGVFMIILGVRKEIPGKKSAKHRRSNA